MCMNSEGLIVHTQYAAGRRGIPAAVTLRRAARAAWRADAHVEVGLRIVDVAESFALNQQFRGGSGPTNVLSFPASAEGDELPQTGAVPYLGDIVLCAPVLEREACEQHKALHSHYAHMVVHGMLHLQGYDHETEAEAIRMEQLEREILADLGYDDPYADRLADFVHEEPASEEPPCEDTGYEDPGRTMRAASRQEESPRAALADVGPKDPDQDHVEEAD